MAKVPPKEVSDERKRIAWRLRQQGWTQQRIADHIGVTQQAVDVMLSVIEKQLAVEFKEQAAQIKARQTAMLEDMTDETLQQWRRSYEDAVTEVTVKGKTTGGKGEGGADGDKSRAQVTRTVVGQSGNPSLIAQARGTLSDIRSIWGLDAPKREELTGKDGAPIEIHDSRAELAARLAARAARRRTDSDDPGATGGDSAESAL
jgi:predicted transcriptional regulator